MQWTIQGTFAGALLLSASALQAQPPQAPRPQPFQQAPQQAQPQPKQDVVATVNGEPITKTQLEATLQSNLQGKQVDPQTAEKFKKQVLNQMIEGRLIEQHVAKKGPEVKPEEVESVVTRVKQQLQAQDVSFDQYLTARGLTENSFKKRIKGSLGWRKYQQENVKPENLREFFKNNPNKFQAEKFEEAQQQVAQVYVASLWENIVQQQKPKAEIKILNDGSPNPQQRRPAAPNAFPR